MISIYIDITNRMINLLFYGFKLQLLYYDFFLHSRFEPRSNFTALQVTLRSCPTSMTSHDEIGQKMANKIITLKVNSF